MNVLALSGSLRARSINSALLRAAATLAPPGMSITLCAPLAELPFFNPDLEIDPPATVKAFRSRVGNADALLIASPEYAHGVSGTLKNALDWLVGSEAFVCKPVAVFNASPRARHADASLRETLRTMSVVLVERACITIPLLGAGVDETGIVADRALAASVRRALFTLLVSVLVTRRSSAVEVT